MPLTINGKTFMNLQEAVAWLLANNALPFQSTASFAPDTEIAKSTITNPSPAEIKIGSLVLFADGKVGTVSAITSNGFKVGQDATDLSDGVPHITDIQIDASNHLIFTMSEGDPIDAGLIKEVSSMSIDASQHLIVNYNDGTTNDLGAIFQGNVNIAGNLTADSIIENMTGYSYTLNETADITYDLTYVGAVKNGNKITLAIVGKITTGGTVPSLVELGEISIPASVASKLYNTNLGANILSSKFVDFVRSYNETGIAVQITCYKEIYDAVKVRIYYANNQINANNTYFFRYEETFLLSDNLAS